MDERYLKIINLKRPISKKHKPMPIEDRAAQFGAFAALSGYDTQIKETGRITTNRKEIDEEVRIELDRTLRMLKERVTHMPKINITYFVKDRNKEGGKYIEITGNLRRIDDFNEEIVLENKIRIPIKDIIKITYNKNN